MGRKRSRSAVSEGVLLADWLCLPHTPLRPPRRPPPRPAPRWPLVSRWPPPAASGFGPLLVARCAALLGRPLLGAPLSRQRRVGAEGLEPWGPNHWPQRARAGRCGISGAIGTMRGPWGGGGWTQPGEPGGPGGPVGLGAAFPRPYPLSQCADSCHRRGQAATPRAGRNPRAQQRRHRGGGRP